MKKYALILLLIMGCNIVVADEFLPGISDEALINNAKLMIPVFQKLYTCTPATTQYFKIYGLNNGYCRFKPVGYNCRVPMNATKKYSSSAIKGAREVINGNFSTEPDTPESRFIEYVHKTYCTTTMK